MNALDVVVLLGFAALDSLNPFSVAAMVYLLGTDRPGERGAAFVAGTFGAYFVGALALWGGWGALLARLAPRLPGWASGAGLAAAGVACVGFGVWSWRRATDGRPVTPPASLGLGATIGFAIASTAGDLPTAVPLLAAVNRLAATATRGGKAAALFALYCIVYVAPLVALLAVRLRAGAGAARGLSRVRDAVDWGFARLLPPALVVGGLWMCAHVMGRLMRAS